MEEDAKNCLFCSKNLSNYTCPQCLARYCSLKCYQHENHLQCSENFYKEQVLDELKDTKGSSADKQIILNLLSKFKQHSERSISPDGNDTINLSERLADVSLNDTDTLWKKLAPHERDMFQRYVSNGNLNFVPIWNPWWIVTKRSKIVELPADECRTSEKLPVIKRVSPMKELLQNKPPNPKLKFCIIEVMLAYLCSERLFNGDLFDSAEESFEVLLQLSNVLSKNMVFSDVHTCLLCFVNNVSSRSDVTVDPIAVCLEDLLLVLSKDSFTERVFSDLHSYLKKCRKIFREHNALPQQLFKVTKKVYFYTAYCQEYGKDIQFLENDIRDIQRQLLEDRQNWSEQKAEIEKNLEKLKPRNHPLIQEIS